MNALDRMRAEWNQRAKKDAHFYVAFGSQNQTEEDFRASALENTPAFEREFPRLPARPVAERRALEIGCGPGRLMLPMSRHFGEIHGVDISDEMLSLARERLRGVSNAHVHLTTGADLGMFEDSYFDFVYSYIVFQHIPDRAIVLNYLREAHRVLKPEGVLCCQLRGAKPLESELSRETETWTGCYFSADEMAAFSREHSFPLVALSGLETQYMWTTFRKTATAASPTSLEKCVVKAITGAASPEPRIPARGRDAAVSLWIEGMPDSANLANCLIEFGSREQLGCYISPVSESGGCQLNARLPDGLAPGEYEVRLRVGANLVPGSYRVSVMPPPPFAPRVLSVTDGINLRSPYRLETRSAKVVIEDVRDPESVAFTIAGLPPSFLQYERKDPITSSYDFSFHLAQKTPRGRHLFKVRIDGRELAPIEIDVA